jgi:hypothetical protein
MLSPDRKPDCLAGTGRYGDRKPLFNRNFGAIADGFSAATVVPPAHERNGPVGIPP